MCIVAQIGPNLVMPTPSQDHIKESKCKAIQLPGASGHLTALGVTNLKQNYMHAKPVIYANELF